MNYTDLINKIAAYIIPGTSKGVSAEKLKELYSDVVQFANETRGDYQGSITPTDSPGSLSNSAYFFAEETGTYSNFGGIVVSDSSSVNLISYNINSDSWSLTSIPFSTSYTLSLDELKDSLSVRKYLFIKKGTELQTGELEALKVLKNIVFEYIDNSFVEEEWKIKAFSNNHTSPYEYYINFENVNTPSIEIGHNFTAQEISDKYSEFTVLTGDYAGTKIKIWFDYNLTTSTGLLISSTAGNHYLVVKNGISISDKNQLVKNTSNISSILDSIGDLDFTPIPSVEIVDGFYHQNTGLWTSNVNYRTIKADISSISNDIYASSTIRGSGTALAVYFDINEDFIESEFQGVLGEDSMFLHQKISPPAGTVYVAITMFSTEVFGELYEGFPIVMDLKELRNSLYSLNQWRNKSVLFLGTSVLFGQWSTKSYALEAANILKYNLINTGVPGLAIHANSDGMGGLDPEPYGSSCLSIAEYAIKGTIIASDPIDPYTPGGGYNNHYKTWENIFKSENQNADLYVFAVGPNNDRFDLDDWNDFDFDTWSYNTGTFEDHRTTFLGALIYMFNKMYLVNPNARAVLLLDSGFKYDESKADFERFAAQFKMPIIDLWAKSNYNPITKAYLWSEGGTNQHPSTLAHEIMGKILAQELLLIS